MSNHLRNSGYNGNPFDPYKTPANMQAAREHIRSMQLTGRLVLLGLIAYLLLCSLVS